jgi:hypothetical protein
VKNINHQPAEMKINFLMLFLLLKGFVLYSQVPLNWTIDEINPNEDIKLYPDESVFTDGTKSCRLQLYSGAVPYLISDSYSVSPGTSYEFSIDVLDNDTAGQLKVFADFYDAYGFNIYGGTPAFSSDSSEWQTISWEGTIPDQAVTGYVLIKFYCEPDLYHFTRTAEIWIDNVQFRQSGGANLVSNGSFEEWIVGVEEPGNYEDPLAIYPNPAVDFVNINLPEDVDFIVISDLTAREMLRMKVDGRKKIQVDLRQFPGGLYLISSVIGPFSVRTGKLFKL